MRLLQPRLQHVYTRRQQPNWDSIKAFIKILMRSNVMNLQILTIMVSVLPALLHWDKICSSKCKFIRIPRSFWCLHPTIHASVLIRQWHLSSSNSMKLQSRKYYNETVLNGALARSRALCARVLGMLACFMNLVCLRAWRAS